jgi:hypothetical protein
LHLDLLQQRRGRQGRRSRLGRDESNSNPLIFSRNTSSTSSRFARLSRLAATCNDYVSISDSTYSHAWTSCLSSIIIQHHPLSPASPTAQYHPSISLELESPAWEQCSSHYQMSLQISTDLPQIESDGSDTLSPLTPIDHDMEIGK